MTSWSTLPLGALSLAMWNYCTAFVCHTCQYSENAPLIGYECVTSPGEYNLGPATGVCSMPCYSWRQVSHSTGTVYYMWRGCQPAGSRADGCESELYYEDCRETCSSDTCNGNDMSASSSQKAPANIRNTSTETTGPNHCYSCVYTHNPDVADICVSDVAHLPSSNHVVCPLPKVCFTFRQWDKGNKVVRSFSRGCSEMLGRVTECVDDAFFFTCGTFCTGQYCNDGDGIPDSAAAHH